MEQVLHLSPYKHIYELQQEFASFYPYLRLDFYREQPQVYPGVAARSISRSSLLSAAGLATEGSVIIDDAMTIASLESMLREKFGLHAQVIRQSGSIWLETTMTDDWTLKQQNDHGSELSRHLDSGEIKEDFDLGRGNLS